jgi:hypothetical protein
MTMLRGAYWQTFTNKIPIETYDFVILAAVHFGVESDGQVYIHLNDRSIWDCAALAPLAREKGRRAKFRVGLMIGGAGGGFSTLFEHFDRCMALLSTFLEASSLIDFIDLDPEETITIPNLVKFAHRLPRCITAAPITLSTFWNHFRAHESVVQWHLQTYSSSQWTDQAIDELCAAGWPLQRMIFGYTASTFSTDEDREAAMDIAHRRGIRGTFEWDPR